MTYQAENAYVVHASGRRSTGSPRWWGPMPAVRAVIPRDRRRQARGGGRRTPAGATRSRPSPAAPGEDARDRAAAAGPAVGAPATVGALRTQYLELSAAELAELARDPGVVAIERDAPPTPSDERAAQIVAGNLSAPRSPSRAAPAT